MELTLRGALYGIGGGLQIVGIAVAAWGYWRTWREFAPKGEGLLDPITAPVVAAAALFVSLVISAARRILRRPTRRKVHAGAALGFSGSLKARAIIGYGDLPADSPSAIAELGRRTQQLAVGMAVVEDRLGTSIASVQEQVMAVDRRAVEAARELGEQDRRVAVSGIRVQSLGLLLVAVGLVLGYLSPVVVGATSHSLR